MINQFEQKNEKSIWTEIWTIILNIYMNNQFEHLI